MNRQSRQQVADAFGIDLELLPLLPEVLADIWELGSWPERILELLRDYTDLEPGATVLDLGCGKGAVAVTVARELDFEVHGIDLFLPFLEEARRRAEGANLGDRCRFEAGDIRDAVQNLTGFEVVVLAAVGAGGFGEYSDCLGHLRQTLRPGGYVVIDDGFLVGQAASKRVGYEYYRSHQDTVQQLQSRGDRIVQELQISRSELEECNARNMNLIRLRAGEAARENPELAASLERYVESEEAECRFLENETTAAIWLLQCC
jgi:SAM-dependent methyltransferase